MDVISFARGAPSVDIVDIDGLREAANQAFTDDAAAAVTYGTAVGHLGLREWIAHRHNVDPKCVIVTNGSMQADALLFSILVQPGTEVVTERPSYDRTLLLLGKLGAKLTTIELESDGINLNALEEHLQQGGKPEFVHIIPNFHNPAGCTLSLAKRKRLLELADRYDFLILEDDPYRDLRFAGEDIPSMFELQNSERVIYASTFSKTICPGVRVGYLIGPEELITQVTKLATETYISPDMTAQAIVNQFCRSGKLEQSVASVKVALAQRCQAMADSLTEQLPQWEFLQPQGGYFMWVKLPSSMHIDTLFDAAKQDGVAIVKGTDFMLAGGEHQMRLSYSAAAPTQIEVGVRRLAQISESLLT